LQDHRSDQPVPGELIWIRRRQWRVRSSHAGAGLTRLVVDGWAPSESRSFLIPSDRFTRESVVRHRPVSPGRALAWLAACTARTHPAWTPGSVVASRSAIYAFQLEPALAMLAGRRRILIADDVGLGKTIQAALMIAETLERCTDARVLVIAPASLVAQWSGELHDRFGIDAQTADADTFVRLRAARAYLSNPWAGPGVWLASADYVKQPHVREAMPESRFDLVVIDEAHTVAGHSQRHATLDAIARAARHVILLTATPHDGDSIRFRRLASFGASGSSTDELTIFRRTRTGSTRQVRQLDVRPGAGLTRVLAAIDSFEQVRRPEAPVDGLALICAVFRKRAVSSLAALTASLRRRLDVINNAPASPAEDGWTQPNLGFGGSDDDVMSVDEWQAMNVATGLSRTRERSWLERLLNLAGRTLSGDANADAKLSRLTALLRRTDEAVVVFTEYRDSLLAIADALAASRRAALLHGGLSGPEQRRALRLFLDGEADVLIATDVASQGLNLQHRTRWVIHFDLPWTPMRIEQRIGRIDRIGQSRIVHVTSIGIRHRAQAALRERVIRREEMRDHVPLRSCARWTRAANGLARLFAHQRALAARWRGPDPAAVPLAQVTRQVMDRICGSGSHPSISLIEIAFTAGSGEVIERWLGWRVPGLAEDATTPARLIRRARALSARARRRWAAVQGAQSGSAAKVPGQPGLFDVHLSNPISESCKACERSDPSPSVRIGEPRTLLVLERRR
jgi:superfamily II DNA or RNA helicase